MKRNFFIFMLLGAMTLSAITSCDKKDDPEPPKPSTTLESISVTAPTVKEENRTIVDKAGEFSYTDKADATVKMTFKNAEPASKDSAIVANLTSKVTWPTTPPQVALTGELVLTPTLTGTDKITVKYGTLEFKDFLTISNTELKVTRSGKTADMPFFGFNKVEAFGDATSEMTYVTEGDKNYRLNTLTQKFKITHSDGTTKEIETKLAVRVESGVSTQGKLKKVEVINWKAEYDANVDGYKNTYNLRLIYENVTKDTIAGTYQYMRYLPFFDQEAAIRVFSDKATIEPTFSIEETVGSEQSAHSWLWYYRPTTYYLSVPQVQPNRILRASTEVDIIKWDGGKLDLPGYVPTITYKSVKYETAFDQTIDGDLYKVTPAEIHFEYALGNDIKKTAFFKVEICNKK